MTLQELSHADIVAYKEFLLNSNKSALTVNLYLSSLRGFFKWAEKKFARILQMESAQYEQIRRRSAECTLRTNKARNFWSRH